MARMHSGAKGKSGSTKPSKKAVPSWVKYKPKEVEILVTKYAKEGKKPSQIGMYLRDEYGIPDVKILTGKTITQVLKEKKMLSEIPEDMLALMKKSVLLRKHMDENKSDFSAKRGLFLTDSKIRRLAKHYKKSKVLPAEWKYDPEKVKIYVQ
jgi:small subunit ribosomal protein S15